MRIDYYLIDAYEEIKKMRSRYVREREFKKLRPEIIQAIHDLSTLQLQPDDWRISYANKLRYALYRINLFLS